MAKQQIYKNCGGFDIVLKKINSFEKEVKEKFADIDSRFDKSEQRDTEVLKLVNQINEKISVNHIEEKAAVMDAIQKFVGTKFGKCVFFLLVVSTGLAIAYIVEHGGLSAIASVVK